jgi:Domain of unknown function (DUF4333)
MHTSRSAALALVLAVLAIACLGRKLDKKKIEQNIHDELLTKGVNMKLIDCPAGRPLSAGDKFDCTGIDSDGETLVFHVTQTDAAGSFKWEMDGMVLNLAKIGDSIESKVGRNADVQCPEKSVIMQVGHSFTCNVDIGGKGHKVLLTLTDTTGRVTWKLLD